MTYIPNPLEGMEPRDIDEIDQSRSELELKRAIANIKADAITDAAIATLSDITVRNSSGEILTKSFMSACSFQSLKEYAEKVRRGEV